VHFVTFAAYSV